MPDFVEGLRHVQEHRTSRLLLVESIRCLLLDAEDLMNCRVSGPKIKLLDLKDVPVSLRPMKSPQHDDAFGYLSHQRQKANRPVVLRGKTALRISTESVCPGSVGEIQIYK